MKPIISVEGLSKRYSRYTGPKYDSLRERLSHLFTSPSQQPNLAHGASDAQDFWALRDVSFEVNQGDVVGIVGRNGAGKSTLLKILSRITEPTSGRAKIHGRVGSLLEVGTGFHPELTGRENVFLNGAILGMKPAEVQRKFDEIVAFSGVEQFLDMPVKRYSSGMITRLAFSVAAHLEPEVLVVDEVLSVGDSFFRKKCMGKMRDVAGEGRTVLFVSHNLNAIRGLCNRAIYLKNGALVEDSQDVHAVVAMYLNEQSAGSGQYWENTTEHAIENAYIRPIAFMAKDAANVTIERPIASDEDITIQIDVDVKLAHPDLAIGYSISNEIGELLYWSYTTDDIHHALTLEANRLSLSSVLPPNLLNDGEYVFTLIAGVMNEKSLFTLTESPIRFSLEVEGNKNRSQFWQGRRQTSIAPIIEWQCDVKLGY